jgi:hypothetical protein
VEGVEGCGSLTDSILEVLDRIEAPQRLAGGEPRNALEYVQDVYRGRRIDDPWRMRAAIAALQFETPRLGVIATTNINDKDFAALLDRAIERSNGVREVKQIRRALPKPE